MLQFFQILMLILPPVCLYFHIMKDKKRTKMFLSAAQTIAACSAIQTLRHWSSISGGADQGMEFLQQLPLVIYWIFAISGVVCCIYYELKYKKT